MKKLALTLDDLKVDTFQVEPPEDLRRGTVLGHVDSETDFSCYLTNCHRCSEQTMCVKC